MVLTQMDGQCEDDGKFKRRPRLSNFMKQGMMKNKKGIALGPSINYVMPNLAIYDPPPPHVTISVKILIDLNKRKMQ